MILEKPIGQDYASSVAINEAVGKAFTEDQVFRIDHYLGKEAVQNLLALRFANSLFEPLWNSASIDHVQITVAETVGVEGRWGYYDDAGALRDMVQNHMLQLVALVAMEPPHLLEPGEVRNEKTKVLRSLRPDHRGHRRRQHRARPVHRGQRRRRGRAGLQRGSQAPRATATRKPSSRCVPRSTTGAGRACRSTCAPASACNRGAPTSPSSSSPCRTTSSRPTSPICRPTGW